MILFAMGMSSLRVIVAVDVDVEALDVLEADCRLPSFLRTVGICSQSV